MGHGFLEKVLQTVLELNYLTPDKMQTKKLCFKNLSLGDSLRHCGRN